MADKLIEVPGQGVVAFPDSMSDAEIEAVIQRETASQPDPRGAVERFAEPFVAAGKGLASLGGEVLNIPSNLKARLEKNPLGGLGGAIGGGVLDVLKGIGGATKADADKEAQDFSRGPKERTFRTAVASVPLVGQSLLGAGDKLAEGNYAGVVGEGLLNFGPAALGKVGKLKRLKAGALEDVAAAARAANTPVGRMVDELGGNKVSPEVTTQRAAKIAEEELQKVGARTRNLRGDAAPDLSEVAASPEHLKSSIKDRLAARDEELRYITDRGKTQMQIEEMRLKDELLSGVPEKFTPTEAGSFIVPELKSRLSDLQARFPKGTKGYDQNVAPFLRGAPGKALSKAKREVMDQVGKIPLESAQQWGLLAKNVAGDADAVRALRSDFINNRLGAASKSADAFVTKLRSTPPDTLYAVLGEDAAPMMRTLDRLDELANRGQNMTPRGGKVIPTQRLEVLESALDEIGRSRAGRGLLGQLITKVGIPTHSRILRVLPIIASQGSPQSVLRFWRAFDVFTRNGYAPAFIQTVNAIERRTREEEQRSNEQPN